MEKKITGGCHCGQFRYETTSELIAPHYCHCADCRKLYGAVGAGFVVIEEQTAMTGDISVYESEGDSGNRKQHLFCGVCGTPIGERVDAYSGPSCSPRAHWTSRQPLFPRRISGSAAKRPGRGWTMDWHNWKRSPKAEAEQARLVVRQIICEYPYIWKSAYICRPSPFLSACQTIPV